MTALTPVHRPTRPGGVLSIGAATLAMVVLASMPSQYVAIGLILTAIGTGWVASRTWSGGYHVGAVVVLVIATVLVVMGLLIAMTGPPRIIDRVWLLPGLIGLVILALGLAPLRQSVAAQLVTAGTGGVFIALLAAGVFVVPTSVTLVGAAIMTIVAWDAGHNALSLGTQIGRGARTGRTEVVHTLGALCVGVVTAAWVLAVEWVGFAGMTLGGFLVLGAGTVLLAIGLRS